MKKVLSVLLSFVMLFSITTMADFSAYALTSGDWQYSVIIGGGVSITGYKGSETELVIPSKLGSLSATVKSIGENAFKDNTAIKSVIIPDTVTSIGKSAFSGCTQIESIVIPDSVTEIGQSAFSVCTQLSSMVLPDTIESISTSMFNSCSSLKTITLPSNLKTIGSSAFMGCESLSYIDIPASVSNIEMVAFVGCTSLTSIVIPESLTTIKAGVFSGCWKLKSVFIPNTLKSIEVAAFAESNSLTDVYFQGTREEWNKVKVDYSKPTTDINGNDPLLNATIHCTDDQECSVTVMPSSLGTAAINGVDVMDDVVSVDVPQNSDVTLKAIPSKDAVFAGWSVNGKIVYTDAVITIKALADVTYVPVFQAADKSFTVVFTDKYGNIFSTQQVMNGDEIDFDSVKTPTIAGYIFKGWSITPEDAVQLKGPASIQAVYEKDSSKGYTVTAVGCTITAGDETVTDVLENVPYDTLVTVYKQYNSAWSINGAVAAYGQSYSFYVGADVTLTTWDGPVVLAPTVAAVSVTEIKDGDKIKAAFLATRSMTADCTYVSSGFVYGKNLENDDITLADVKAGSSVKAYYAATDAQQFALTYSLADQKGKMTARAFLAYTDANGETQIIYAKPQTYTYSA